MGVQAGSSMSIFEEQTSIATLQVETICLAKDNL